jgi:hypothetical protein
MTTRGPYTTMAATGTTQATAAEVIADKVLVTTVTATAAGVVLPPGNRDQDQVIVNGQGTHTLFVYPRSGGKLNNATADQALELPPYKAARLVGVNSLDWMAFY